MTSNFLLFRDYHITMRLSKGQVCIEISQTLKFDYLFLNFIRGFMTGSQQALTNMISSLESVIIRVDLILWPQDKMS